jgi:hypothetical protein
MATTRVLCLFTRYARSRDVVRARRHGFLSYRWDGTLENCRLTAASLLGSGWIGLLYPDERVTGDEDALAGFLAALPASVGEVRVDCGNAGGEPRFFRIGDRGVGTGQAFCPAVRIAGSNVRTFGGTR